MADFRTSTQRESWIFQSHDLVSPGAQGLLSYALSRSRRLSDLLTIRRARARPYAVLRRWRGGRRQTSGLLRPLRRLGRIASPE